MYNRIYSSPGLGAYPGDPYYDSTRPAWLPYWVDTPGENAQKWGFYPGADVNQTYPLPSPPVTIAPPVDLPANPSSAAQANAVIAAQIAAQAQAQREQTRTFFDSVSEQLDTAQAEREKESKFTNALLWGGAAVVAVVLLKR